MPNIKKILDIKNAFENGSLGSSIMPEDTHPKFESLEQRYIYFSLPMALNYQRNSYKLWEAANKTFLDPTTKDIFVLSQSINMSVEELRQKMITYKLALQPNNHPRIWQTISDTVYKNWGTFTNLFESHEFDFLQMKKTLQKTHKKDFPYLSGPKIFNYWAYIMEQYCALEWKNREYISIAPDTHIIQASIKLEVITKDEAKKLSKDEIAEKWRITLKGTDIAPIDMHSPLWFWSRGGFHLNR